MKKLEIGSVWLLDTLTLISILRMSQTEQRGVEVSLESGQCVCVCSCTVTVRSWTLLETDYTDGHNLYKAVLMCPLLFSDIINHMPIECSYPLFVQFHDFEVCDLVDWQYSEKYLPADNAKKMMNEKLTIWFIEQSQQRQHSYCCCYMNTKWSATVKFCWFLLPQLCPNLKNCSISFEGCKERLSSSYSLNVLLPWRP